MSADATQTVTPSPSKTLPSQLSRPRVSGLDTLRGVLALAVFFFHGAMPPLMDGYDSGNALLRKVNSLYTWLINGQMAVIVFFLISGFCIHYAFVFKAPNLASFYVHRVLRLALPAAVIIVATWLLGMRDAPDLNGIPIWSLWCELTYYLAYPLFHVAIKRGHWKKLLLSTYALAALILLFSGFYGYYHEYGYVRCTLIGLPVWLLGAYLAEHVSHKSLPKVSVPRIWLIRLGMLGVSCLTLTLAYTKVIGLGWSLTAISPLLFLWVREEIATYQARPEPFLMERIGRFSYSLYLCHLLGIHVADKLPLSKLGVGMAWMAKVSLVLLLSYVFYRLIEEPSQRLSRHLGKTCGRFLKKVPPEVSSSLSRKSSRPDCAVDLSGSLRTFLTFFHA